MRWKAFVETVFSLFLKVGWWFMRTYAVTCRSVWTMGMVVSSIGIRRYLCVKRMGLCIVRAMVFALRVRARERA